MNIEDDDEEEADYGVFGDANCTPMPRYRLSSRDLAEMARWKKLREAEIRTSREFNSYMIELFNRK